MSEARKVAHSMPLIGDAEVAAAERALRSGRLAQGPEVVSFEAAVAEFTGYEHGIAVNSGTAALELALRSLDLESQSRVAIPNYSCAALAHATLNAGLRPHLVDISSDYNIDASDTSAGVEATILTHAFGLPTSPNSAPNPIDDLAQALGAQRQNPAPIAVGSFYATKLITTGGEGGIVLTDDEVIAEFVRDRRDYDNRETLVKRGNNKMTEVAAAIGVEQLKRLPGWIARRREIASRYSEAFSVLPLSVPIGEHHIYFRYVVRCELRDDLMRHLNTRGIEAKPPVFRPLNRYFDTDGDFADVSDSYPESDLAAEQALSIPLHPGLENADIEHVVESVEAFFEN